MADPRGTWRETWRRLSQDAHRLRRYQASKFGYSPATWFLDPAFVCVVLYRLSHLMWGKGYRKAGRFWVQLNSLLTGADIVPDSDLGGGLLIPSPCGVTLSGKAGDNLAALALAGIGGSVRDKDIGAGLGLPVLGNNVTAGQFTGIQGSIRLGDGVVLEAGAGAVVNLASGARMVIAVEPQVGHQLPEHRRAPELTAACGHAAWRRTRADFRADIERYAAEVSRHGPAGAARVRRLSAVLSNPLLAILAYRVSHWLFRNRHHRLARLLCRTNILLHKLTILPESCLGGGLLLPHLAGTILCARAGTNLTLYANSLCTPGGNAFAASMAEAPVIGDDVMVGGHSGVFGAVSVGARVQLGPKAQLMQDAADDTVVWSPMARGSDRAAAAAEKSRPRPAAASTPSQWRLPADRRWRETRRRLEQDRLRFCGAASGSAGPTVAAFPGLTCVRLFRLSHYFHAAGRRRLARWCWLLNIYLTGADISPCCEIGGGLAIPHPAGVALHCRAGAGLTVLATGGIAPGLGEDGRLRGLDDAPQLGDDVLVSHHSGIYGAVRVGDRIRLLPGCILTHSVAEGVTLVPSRLKFRRRRTTPRAPTEAVDDVAIGK